MLFPLHALKTPMTKGTKSAKEAAANQSIFAVMMNFIKGGTGC